MSCVKYRPAVQTALMKTVDPALAGSLLAHWDKYFADRAYFSVNDYVSELKTLTLLNDPGVASSLSTALFVGILAVDQTATTPPLDASAASPGTTQTGGFAPSDSSPPRALPHQAAAQEAAPSSTEAARVEPVTSAFDASREVFQCLSDRLRQLYEGALPGPNQHTDFLQTFHELCIQSAHPSVRKFSMHFGAPPDCSQLVMLVERRELIHLLYLAGCEAIGPAQADQILRNAVQHCEQAAAASLFSPKKLI